MAGELNFSARVDRGVGRRGHLIGFPKKGKSSTVSVNPPSINGGATGTVDVTVTGALPTRRHRVVFVPPTTLEAGLSPHSSAIVDENTVRVKLLNTTGAPINGIARNWTALLYRMGVPALVGRLLRTPAKGALALTGTSPSLLTPASLQPNVSALAVTGAEPTLA